jgi:hypothetical protein
MKKIITYVFLGLILIVAVGLFYNWANSPLAPIESTSALTATLNEISGVVEIKNPNANDFTAAQNGENLEVGGQIRTSADGKVRLDLSSGTILRVAPSSLFIFKSNAPIIGGLFTKLKLEAGKVFVVLNGGSLDIETPSGVASVRGSYMAVGFDPVTRQINVSCLEGICAVGDIPIPAGQVLAFEYNFTSGGYNIPVLKPMTNDDILEWQTVLPLGDQTAQHVIQVAMSQLTQSAQTPIQTSTVTSTPAAITLTPTVTLTPTITATVTATQKVVVVVPAATTPPSEIASCGGGLAGKTIQFIGVPELAKDIDSIIYKYVKFSSSRNDVIVSSLGSTDFFVSAVSGNNFWQSIESVFGAITVNGTSMNATALRTYFTAPGADRSQRQTAVFSAIYGKINFLSGFALYNNFKPLINTDLSPAQIVSAICIYNKISTGRVNLVFGP